jgi:RNA polymerase sigma-70 factor, ECF subfamily
MTMAATHVEHPAEATAALAAALLAREPRAAADAWSAYAPRVQRYLRCQLGPRADWEDLCQEVFLRFFTRIDELRDPAALVGFIYSICLGVARNQRRRAWVRRLMRLTSSGELPDVEGGSRWDPEAREAVARLSALLARMGTEDRSIFITRYVEKMEIADIAAAHGLTFATAKRRVARVSKHLGAKMSRDPLLAEYVDRLRKGASAE